MQKRPSRTAARVAARRAVHQIVDRPLIFEDPLALRILDSDRARHIAQHPGRYANGRTARALRAFLVARSRIAEDALAQAYARGVRQYIVLGAGLDTFAYRNPYSDLRVFEVDHPATQGWKRTRLDAGGIELPRTLTFVSVDFARESLGDRLRDAGVGAAPAFVSWLGVSMYLTRDDVFATLRAVRPWAAAGGLVFDFATPTSHLPLLHRFFHWRFMRRVARAGEPWLSLFEPGVLLERMRDLGYERARFMSPTAINARFFSERADGLRVGPTGGVIVCDPE